MGEWSIECLVQYIRLIWRWSWEMDIRDSIEEIEGPAFVGATGVPGGKQFELHFLRTFFLELNEDGRA